MTTRTLIAYGTECEIDTTVIEEGLAYLDQLREEKAAPVPAMTKLREKLDLTGLQSTAIYAEWMKINKPVF